jgi:hypothetical protein
MGIAVFAQAPQKFNYQGIARDAKGAPLANQKMALKIAILPAQDATVPQYIETHLVTTNASGLYTLQVGGGDPLVGAIKDIDWASGNQYIQVAIDPQGGNSFTDIGTTQLLSVPYALYADKSGTATNATGPTRTGTVNSAAGHVVGDANYVTKFTGLNTIAKSSIFDNGTSIGIGTTTPAITAKLHIFDPSANITELRIQHTNTTSGASRLSLFNDANTGFTATANYAVLNKYATGTAGTVAPGYPLSKLFSFNNSQGNLLLSSGKNIGLGTFNQATSTVTVRMHIDSATGSIGIGTITPTAAAKLDVAGRVKISGGTPGAGKVLTSDATGLASWTTPAVAVSSLNGATGAVVNSLTMGAAGTNTAVTGSGTNAVTINIPTASATNTGKLSNTDWTTFNNKASTVGGTLNYIPKYTPNGTTLGNSKLIDNTTGLLYNTTYQDLSFGTGFNGITMNNPNSVMTIKNNSIDLNYLNLVSPAIFKGFWLYDSTKFGFYNDSTYSFILRNEDNNILHLGSDSYGLSIAPGGRMGNSGIYSNVGNAALNINTAYDTAGHFTSSSTNDLYRGILRSEYTGLYGSSTYDNVGVYGKALVDINYGIGVQGEGGFYGVYGETDSSGLSGVNGYGFGNATGVIGNSESGSGVYGSTSSGFGVYGVADAFALGFGYGGYFIGKQTGVYGQADSASASQTEFITNIGLSEAIGVLGKSSAYSDFGSVNEGVAGSTVDTTLGANIGVFAEANRAANGNFGVYAVAPTSGSSNYAGYFVGNVTIDGDIDISGNLAKSSGTFKIDHPQDPANKYLIHSFVESPDMMNVYNGNITTDANGVATVSLPTYFEAENKDFKYQLTVIDNSADFVMAKVTKEVKNNTFEVKSSKPGVKISWQVTGVRQDAFANAHRIVDVVDKAPSDKGYYIHPELFGAPATQKVGVRFKPTSKHVNTLPTPAEHKANRLKMEENKKMHNEKNKNAERNWKPQVNPTPIQNRVNPTGR